MRSAVSFAVWIGGPSDTAGPGVAYPLTPPLDGLSSSIATSSPVQILVTIG